MRLDVFLAEKGLASSRERAKRLILSGGVTLDGKIADKPSLEVEGDPEITVREENFVGRGGEKLAAALSLFGVSPKGCRALDIGASTGGFTDCLLRKGARRVVALDAGFGQLHPRLLADPRVISIERCNARHLNRADVGRFDLVVMDVSFISQTYILPQLGELLYPHGRAITLIKPQFEAGRAALNKNGLVKSPRDRIAAIRRVLGAAAEHGLTCQGVMPSPIKGGDGNEEFLAIFSLEGNPAQNLAMPIEKAVMEGVMVGEDCTHHKF